jgi:TIR domain
LVESSELAEEVAKWSPDTYAHHASENGPSASVAAKLLADPALRRILTGAQGKDWLTDPVLRQASVSFLLDQQRLSPLDTSEVNVRYDAFISYPREDRKEVLKIAEAISKEGIKVFFDEEIRPGERWQDAITEGLSSAGTMLFA